MVNHCRVVENTLGSVSVINADMDQKKDDESENKFLNRFFKKTMDKCPRYKGQPFFDTTTDKLPDDSKRDKWRMKSDKKGIKVDSLVITINEKIQAILDEIEVEKAMPEGKMNVEKVVRLQEKIKTKDY